MNKILDTLQDIKDMIDTRQFSENIFEDKNYSQPCHSISSKITKHIFFSGSTETKADSNSLGKHSSTSCYSSPGKLQQVTLKYINEFMGVMWAKAREELNFYIINSDLISRIQHEPPSHRSHLDSIKDILNLDVFVLLSKKENPYFYKIDAIIERFQTLVDTLDEVITILSKENLMKVLPFYEEVECLKCLMKYFPAHLFENDCFRKVCCELWRFMRNTKFIEPTESNVQLSFDNVKLYLHGISFPSPYPEDYPLHKAVFYSNLTLIGKICARDNSPIFHSHIEQSDPVGVTPLMLAVLLGDKDAATILTDHGANPKHRSHPHARTPLEEAVHQKNRGMVKLLLVAATNIKKTLWEDNKASLIEFLKTVPDFSFEMNWECDSRIIPFVKKVAPSDTYKIHKRGGSIRIDLTLLGWSKLKSIRGNSSIIFNGQGAGEGKLLMIDQTKKVAVDILADMSTMALENKVELLVKQEQTHSQVKTENVMFKPATTWKGEPVRAQINEYECTKYIAKGTFSLLFTRRNVLGEVDAKIFDHYEQYFSFILQEPLWVLEDNPGHIDWSQSPLLKIKRYAEYYQSIVKTLFDKDGKDNGHEHPSRGMKLNKDMEKLSISQKRLLKNYTKNIVATVYMCENFPLNLDHFFPILEILSNVSPHINRLKGFLEKTLSINKTSFPIKASVPIFFSLNANLSVKDFKFISPLPSLFDVDSMLYRSTRKAIEFMFPNERVKTEGGSDDEKIQERWQDLLKHNSDEEVVSYTQTRYQFKGESIDPADLAIPPEKTGNYAETFFKKNLSSTYNRDLVNVFLSDNEPDYEGENLDDFDISEKLRNETLKVSTHGTSMPKTIMFIQAKFTSQEDSRTRQKSNGRNSGHKKSVVEPHFYKGYQNKKSSGDNIHSVKRVSNYKFMDDLNHHEEDYDKDARSQIQGSQQDSLNTRNFNEMDLSESKMREMQMRKLRKYTINKHNLLSKVNGSKDRLPTENSFCEDPEMMNSATGHNIMKSARRIGRSGIKSMDFRDKTNFETFFKNE